MLDKKFDFICSIGEDCACSSYMRRFRLQNASYPFDWLTKATFDTRINLILSNFQSFLDIENFRLLPKLHELTDDRCDYYENTKLELYFYHDFLIGIPLEKTFPSVKAKYERRIKRFYEKIEEASKVLFIWWSRDKIIADSTLLKTQQALAEKFPYQEINLLIFENDFEKKEIEYFSINKNILKVISNFALYDTLKPELETLANIPQTSKVFSKIRINRSISYLIMYPFYKLSLSLCKFLPGKKIRKSLRNILKKKLYLN